MYCLSRWQHGGSSETLTSALNSFLLMSAPAFNCLTGLGGREEPGLGERQPWLLIVDESHVAVPQTASMYNADRARKLSLVLRILASSSGFSWPSVCVKISGGRFSTDMRACVGEPPSAS